MTKVLDVIEANGYRIEIRPVEESDIPHLADLLVNRVFMEILPTDSVKKEAERYRGRFETYPEGIFVAEDVKNSKVVGVHSAQLLQWGPYNAVPATWIEMTDDGCVRKTHNPKGNAWHIVTNVVDREYAGVAGLGIGTKLLNTAIKSFTNNSALEYMFVGHMLGRADKEEIRYFRNYLGDTSHLRDDQLKSKLMDYASSMSINPKTGTLEPIDKVTRFYTRAGLRPRQILLNWEGDAEYDYCLFQLMRKG